VRNIRIDIYSHRIFFIENYLNNYHHLLVRLVRGLPTGMKHLCATKGRLPRCAASASYHVRVHLRLEDGSGANLSKLNMQVLGVSDRCLAGRRWVCVYRLEN
jgi:hypothetical protein